MRLFRGGESRSGGFLTAGDYLAEARSARLSGGSSGVRVDYESAQRHSAVWACQSAIAEAIQQLPLQEVRVGSDGVSSRRRPPAVFFDPAPAVTWETWIWQQAWTLAGRGRAYAYVTGVTQAGVPTGLVPVSPSLVRWRWDRDAGRWVVFLGTEQVDLWPLGPLWHCPLYATPECPEGLSPIELHAESIGVGLAAQRFGGQFFGDGGHPSGVMTVPGSPTEEQQTALKARIKSVMQGNREPLLLPVGTTYEKFQVSPDEAQFLDTMRYSGEDVCRIYGVPPGKIGLAVSGQNVTYTNVSDANADWRVGGLSRYVVALESALSRLVPNGANRVLRFDFDEFLRPDPEARFRLYELGSKVGDLAGTPVLFPNEMRLREGLPPVEGGDSFNRKQTPSRAPGEASVVRSDGGS